MRSGSNWVGTDWYCNQSQTFHFTHTYNTNTRRITVNWWLTTECNDSKRSPTYYLCHGNQILKLDGTVVVSQPPTTIHNSSTAYCGFTDSGSWLDNNYGRSGFYFDVNGDYVGIRRWVQCLGTKWQSGSFSKEADGNGSIQFSVYGDFAWYGTTRRTFSKTFTITEKSLIKTFSVKYSKNDDDFVKGNSVSNMPTTQTKTYGEDITLSKSIPKSSDKNGNENYKFYHWASGRNSSFSGTNNISPGDKYVKEDDVTLYAIWKRADWDIKYSLNGGTTSSPTTVSVKYDKSIDLLTSSKVSKYGYTLSGWETPAGTTLSPGASYTCRGKATLKAQYLPNSYTIRFMSKDGKTRLNKTITAKYGEVLTGDFSYSVPGYELIGWNTKQVVILNPDDSVPPITPNEAYNDSTKYSASYMYIGGGKYTTSKPFYVKSGVARKHMIGQTITLYPILKYSTSMYVYTGTNWKLAMPYVYDGTTWKQSLGYIYNNDIWKQ